MGEPLPEGEPDRYLHLGVDYGTSASKVVVRDYGAPGRDRGHVLVESGSYRIPSAVVVSEEYVFLGVAAESLGGGLRARANGKALVYESVKMRLAASRQPAADAPRVCFAPEVEPPDGFSWRDLAVLSVWWLLSLGQRFASRLAGTPAPRLGMTLGVPMSFLADEGLRGEFLAVARAAWHLLLEVGPMRRPCIDRRTAHRVLGQAYEATGGHTVHPDEVVFWLRSEAEAALLSAFKSPAVSAGPYVKVDVGAGTTNASLFRILAGPDGQKEKMVFFAAGSANQGMDAIDVALGNFLGTPAGAWYEYRGREAGELAAAPASNACGHTLDTIMYHGRNRVWGIARRKYQVSRAEIEAWGRAGVFLLGGGASVAALRERMLRHPFDGNVRHRWCRLEAPPDLRLGDAAPARGDLPFLMVAYGLSHLGWEVPVVEGPETVGSVPPLRPHVPPGHEEIYGNG